jgi:hypothetical protein
MIKNKRRVSYKTYGTPAIILEGKYLKDLGFDTGDDFLVEYSLNKIVISKTREEVTSNE